MKASTDKRVAIGFLAAFMLLAIVRFISYSITTAHLDRAQSIDNQRLALTALRTMFISVQDAETGQRGYLLTGEERYLKPYDTATTALPQRFEGLRQLRNDAPDSVSNIDQIIRIAQEKMDELGKTIALNRAGQREAAIEIVRSDRGQLLMEQLRSLVVSEVDRRNTEIAKSVAIVSAERRSGLVAFAGFTALDFAMLLAAFYLVRRSGLARDRAEEQLLAANTLQRAILDGVNTSIISVTPEGVVRTFNRTAQRWLGYTPSEVVGKASPPGWHDETEMHTRAEQLSRQLGKTVHPGFEVFVALARLGGADEREWTYVAKDGRRFPVRLSVTALRDEASGEISGFVGIAHDISQQRRVQQAIVEAKDAADNARATAEDASRTKSLFLANMSHELRTPLNAIIGYSEMLAEDAHAEGREQVVEDLRRINGAGKHLLELINDVLDLSKIEAGKTVVNVSSFELARLVDGVLAIVRPMAARNSNALAVDIDPQLGVMRTDEMKVRQVLLNLTSNACKFTKSGSITLHARPIEDGRTIEIVVRDTGIGMSDDVQSTLFQAFAQAEPSTAVEYGGTGLGLSISREYCRLMGGDITLRSVPGEGSTFTVVLPRDYEAKPDDDSPIGATAGRANDSHEGWPPAHPTHAKHAAGIVLVVDDDPASQELVRRSLDAEGFEVVTASSGGEALQLARQLRPVAITLDVLMPGLDGWAVLTTLKTDPDLAKIPVVMLSIVDDKAMAYALGAKAFLTKPVDRAALSRILAPLRSDAKQSVLIIEDDTASAELLRRAFDAEGWSVRIAENGAVGLELLECESPPTLITLDLMMPVVDGFEFVSRLRAQPKWTMIPIIVVTAKELTDDDQRRLSGGVQQVVQKSGVSRDEIRSVVRDLVRRGTGAVAQGAVEESKS